MNFRYPLETPIVLKIELALKINIGSSINHIVPTNIMFMENIATTSDEW